MFSLKINQIFLLFLTVSLIVSVFYPPFIQAAEPTKTASPSADRTAKMEALQKDIASKAATFMADIQRKLQNRIIVGVIKSKSADSLIIATKDGSRIVALNEDTEYLIPAKEGKDKEARLKDLEVEDYIVVLGNMDETESITAKKVIKRVLPESQERFVMYGEIIVLDGLTATIKTKNHQEQEIVFSLNKDVIYKNSKNKILSKNFLETGDKIVISGERSSSGKTTVSTIYFFPLSLTTDPIEASSSAATPVSSD
ncbi:MAG: hypothetical protein C4584_01465 [Armatimonadetes bacterium]|nr:MAG: hypothetical protein C4584_01465 [Armatimonadota bacterium]